MASALPVYPFDSDRYIGTVTEVLAASAKVNLPRAATPEGQWHHGARLGAGQVGEFVFIECGALALFARVLSVRLPERERLTVEPELGRNVEAHPLGTVQLLASISLEDGEVFTGIVDYPRLGSRVYSAHPTLVQWLAQGRLSANAKTLRVAALPWAGGMPVSVTPERLFGRHCAVLGTTGGGKSWTVARLLEEVRRHQAKVLLIDATGEFHTLGPAVVHLHIGNDQEAVDRGSIEVVMPYSELTEQDLLVAFSPSLQSQAPKLRAAMKSLKLAQLVPALAPTGIVVKTEQRRQPIESALRTHAAQLERPDADFNVAFLPRQLEEECVWPTAGTRAAPDPSRWGARNDTELGYCISLIARIESMLQAPELRCILRPGSTPSATSKIVEFLDDADNRILRLSVKQLSFAFNAREIVANALGRWLLDQARTGMFRPKPLVVFLDEAHQFLGKSVGEEATRQRLDAFELIAKEGRKFSLTMCMATQRPRDIPQGVLSQMGTFIVHRLINHEDREVVERASGELDRSASAFLPTLAPGQAILIGVDFPIPLTLQILKPGAPPDSQGPKYQELW